MLDIYWTQCCELKENRWQEGTRKYTKYCAKKVDVLYTDVSFLSFFYIVLHIASYRWNEITVKWENGSSICKTLFSVWIMSPHPKTQCTFFTKFSFVFIIRWIAYTTVQSNTTTTEHTTPYKDIKVIDFFFSYDLEQINGQQYKNLQLWFHMMHVYFTLYLQHNNLYRCHT